MRIELTRSFGFESAHFLPHVPAEHKCRRVHGHSFRAEVSVAGEVDPKSGWLVDYADIAAAIEPVRMALDHRHLNEVAGLENPTSENIARYIWDKLAPVLPGLSQIVVRETCTSSCTYRGA